MSDFDKALVKESKFYLFNYMSKEQGAFIDGANWAREWFVKTNPVNIVADQQFTIKKLQAEIAELKSKLDVAIEALLECKEPNGKLGLDAADLFEQYFRHIEPGPIGTEKQIFRMGHAQGMKECADIARQALAKIKTEGAE